MKKIFSQLSCCQLSFQKTFLEKMLATVIQASMLLNIQVVIAAGLITRGHDVDELDPKHEMLSEKLHKMFNPHDMGGNWQVAADYQPWMPPLDISGQGLALYENAGNYVLGVDAQRVSGDFPSGNWTMLFNSEGELITDIYAAGRYSNVLYVGDMDNDGHLEWLMWGAVVLSWKRDQLNTDWRSIENQYGGDFIDDQIKLFVMNDYGVLEYKRGKQWKLQYQYAVEKVCPLIGQELYMAPVPDLPRTKIEDEIGEQLCLSALEATDDPEYVASIINKLQDYPRKNWLSIQTFSKNK